MVLSFRNMAALCIARLLMVLGFVNRAKKRALNGEFIISLYFHSPGKRLFESIVNWFLQNEFHFLSIEDLDLIIDGKKVFPKGGVLLTFDDGWLSNKENVIEVANKYKIPVTIFITTNAVEEGTFWWSHTNLARKRKLINQKKNLLKQMPNSDRLKLVESIRKDTVIEREALTIEQVKENAVSKNIAIGAHTVTHPILTNCDDLDSFEEIQRSKFVLEKWLKKEINTFAFPNGNYSAREIEYLEQACFNMAFTTKEEYLTLKKLLNKYELPRFYIYESASLSENICRMMGVWLNKKTFFRRR